MGTDRLDIGIFGGSFNPIHIGHLIAAEEVYHQRALSKVIFMPTGISPHKEVKDLLDASHRYQMVKDAIRDNEHFEVSDIEMKRSGKSYTIDTIRIFQALHGEKHNVHLIVGTDMIHEISTWKDIDALSRICRFIVVNRLPVSLNKHNSEYPFPKGFNGKNLFSSEKQAEIEELKVTIPFIGISSTEIRARLYHGRSIRYLVPRNVEEYIKTNNLYTKRSDYT